MVIVNRKSCVIFSNLIVFVVISIDSRVTSMLLVNIQGSLHCKQGTL